MQSIDSNIFNRIYGFRRGSVFTPGRFLDLASRDAVDKTLSRLAQKGTLRRLARGLYDYPAHHQIMGILAPSPDAIARALAGQGIRLQPSGAYAANRLGCLRRYPPGLSI